MPRRLFNRLAMVLVAASAAGLRAETATPRPPGLEDLLALKTISTMTYVMKARTPTLIQHGENDRRVPIPNAYELRQGLEDRGVPVEMVVYKGFDHGISKPKAMRAVMQHNLSWFGHYIFGDPAPDLTAPPGGAEAVPSPPKPIDRDAIRKAQAAATAAREQKDWATLVAESRKLVSLAPESTRARYNLACALSRHGETVEAIRVLGRLADQGVQFDLAKDEDLAPLAGAPEFREVATRMQALDAPIGTSTPAFRLPEKDLLVEAVAHDPRTGRFFVSSVHRRKIVLRDPDGATRDFVPEGTEGLLSAMALALDPERRALYVSTQGQSLTRGLREEERGRAAVLEFDLDSARLRRRLVPPVAGASVGDLAVDAGGTLYVADPEAGRIYSTAPMAPGLELLVEAGPITSTQGLTVAADGQHLYAADYLRGIARVHLASGRVELLEAPDRLALTGIDGLVLAGDSLVAIQNGLNPHRVLRLRLDPCGTRVLSGEILERRNPHFDEPTLGVRVQNDFYYVANSQYEAFDREGRPDPARLREPVILRMRLPWLEGGP